MKTFQFIVISLITLLSLTLSVNLEAQVFLVVHNETGLDIDSLVIGNQLIGDIRKYETSDSTEYPEIIIHSNGYLKGTIPISGNVESYQHRMSYSILGHAPVPYEHVKSGTYHFKLEVEKNMRREWDSLFLSPLKKKTVPNNR